MEFGKLTPEERLEVVERVTGGRSKVILLCTAGMIRSAISACFDYPNYKALLLQPLERETIEVFLFPSDEEGKRLEEHRPMTFCMNTKGQVLGIAQIGEDPKKAEKWFYHHTQPDKNKPFANELVNQILLELDQGSEAPPEDDEAYEVSDEFLMQVFGREEDNN